MDASGKKSLIAMGTPSRNEQENKNSKCHFFLSVNTERNLRKENLSDLPLKTGSVFASMISSSGSFLYRIPELSSKMSNVKKFHKLPRLCFWKYYPSCLVSFVQDATSCLRYSDLTTVYFLIFSTFFFVIMNKNSFISPNHYLWLWNLDVENKLKYNEQN